MIKLEKIKTDEYANYTLKDSNGKKYDVNINFMGIEKPKVGTVIYIQKSVLDENVSLNYGLIEKGQLESEDELIMISYNNEKKYLERFYG